MDSTPSWRAFPPSVSPLDDELVAGLGLARLVPQGRLTPRAHGPGHADRGPALPPAVGWLEGSMATPRTAGRRPSQRDRPALPRLIVSCSRLPTCPTVARQSRWTFRTSPEGSRMWA